ncbi:mitochondrial enolase superfamily member 1-like isoform X3 [Lethenteron reissneri]|uniref:mitochondrial enolase superfamily member 1-like isoform X3 n=1 Tax=Lethenteron reissneri TaxID=7753 RepID=UPI002AB6B35A|nr:mitochondrial enolase superfamily member 1-like isoform X3 [Lethenteron reissneri]
MGPQGRVTGITVRDVRFPTSLEQHGSDAMHRDPDYSAAYVEVRTDACGGLSGFGLTFTLGRGNEIVVCAVHAISDLVVGEQLERIFEDFGSFYHRLANDGQLRWVGPEKGVIHLAMAAVLNALWDLWARLEGKPLWKLLSDMEPEQLVSCIDFSYITDALTRAEALEILRKGSVGREARESQLMESGFPAYTTSCAWLGYPDAELRQRCTEALQDGWTRFKVKVGSSLEDDERRCRIIRDVIGPDRTLMLDANQRWDVLEAVEWMQKLARFRPLWIEEPTSPDDVLGHKHISQALSALGIGVATGEQCQNRVVFKQLLQAKALQFCQVDTCRLGGIPEILAVLLMARKFQGCASTWITCTSTLCFLCASTRPPTCPPWSQATRRRCGKTLFKILSSRADACGGSSPAQGNMRWQWR